MGFYVVCDDDSRHESMTKEQILAAITQAIETGSIGNCDTGFITKIKEQNRGGCTTFWVGTQAQYNALHEPAKNCIYIITDDTMTADVKAAFEKAAKDAEASATAAGEASAAALNLATAAEPIDITDKMTVSWEKGTAAVTKVSFSSLSTRFVYSPATKVVFFSAYCIVKGSASAGKYFYIKLGDKYLPTNNPAYIGFALGSSTPKLSADISRSEGIRVVVNEQIEDFEDLDITLTGWYFCDAEGT